jgi:hypothetical protein
MHGTSEVVRNRRRLKLFLDEPYPQEQLSSIVERACIFYRTTLGALAVEICASVGLELPSDTKLDWDCPPPAVLETLAYDVPASVLQQHVIDDGPAWLSPGCRDQACLPCLVEDDKAGRRPYYRRSWAKVATTFCEAHRCPLVRWRKASLSRCGVIIEHDPIYETVRHASTLNARGWTGNGISAYLRRWEAEIDASLCGPTAIADIDCQQARDRLELITLLGTVRSKHREKLPGGRMFAAPLNWSGSTKWVLSRGGSFSGRVRTGSWEDFRTQRGPEYRRASMFLTAASLVPDWPTQVGDLVPWGRPIASASPEWWERIIRPRFSGFAEDLTLLDSLQSRVHLGAAPVPTVREHDTIRG